MKVIAKKTGAVLLSIALSTICCAQADKGFSSRKTSGGFGYAMVTGQCINFTGLNQTLAANGYGQINRYQLSWGGGGGFVFNNLFIGGEGQGFFGNSVQTASNAMSFNGGYGQFSLGYILVSSKHSIFCPILGIGGGGTSFVFTQKNASNNFNEQINNPAGTTTMEAGGLIFTPQLNYQHFISGKGKEGFFIGVMAGYRYCPTEWNLSVNGNRLQNSPTLNMSGFFVSIVLGGGSFIKEQQKK